MLYRNFIIKCGTSMALLLGLSGVGQLSAYAASKDQVLAMSMLRQYCQACHGVGGYRFIYSDDDAAVWDYIHQHNVPKDSKLWSDVIVRVLSWPSDAPPPFDQLMDPPDHDWMPRGGKRLDFASEHVGDESARRFILGVLNAN